MEATVRNVNVDGIKVKVCGRIGIFEQALCEVVMSLFLDCTVGLDIVSHGRMFPLSSIVKQFACKSALEAMLIGHSK